MNDKYLFEPGDYTYDILAPGVFLYKNVFDPTNMTDLLEKESEEDWPYLMWELSPTDRGTVSSYRSSLQMELGPIMLQEVQESNRLHDLHKKWMTAFEHINKCVFQYRRHWDLDLRADEGYRVLKYPSGSQYRMHIDHHRDNGRVLSLVGWLNDDFEGGELYFDHLDLTVPCQAGSLIMFPSSYVYRHAALPIKENSLDIKYSFVTWFN